MTPPPPPRRRLRALPVLLVAVALALALGPGSTGPGAATTGSGTAGSAPWSGSEPWSGSGVLSGSAPAGVRTGGSVLPVPGHDGDVGRPALLASGVLVHDFSPPDVAWGAGHRGVDLAADEGAQVRAPRAGVVTFSGVVVDRPLVVVTHADGLRSTLEPVAGQVAVGAAVAAGDDLGPLGAGAMSHCAPTACLHWGVRRGETYVDPLSLLGRSPIILLPDG